MQIVYLERVTELGAGITMHEHEADKFTKREAKRLRRVLGSWWLKIRRVD